MGIKNHTQMTVFAYDFFLRNNMFALKNGGFLRFFVAFGPSVARFCGRDRVVFSFLWGCLVRCLRERQV